MPRLLRRNAGQTHRNGTRGFALQQAALEHAFNYHGCPICQVLCRSEERSIFFFLSEGMSSPPELERFVCSGGFCSRHYRVAAGLRSNFIVGNFELAALFRSLLNEVGEELLQKPTSKKDPGQCIFCSELREREEGLMRVLEYLLDNLEFKDKFCKHPICERHLRLAVSGWADRNKRIWLLDQSDSYRTWLKNDIDLALAKKEHVNERALYARTLEAIQFLAGIDPAGAVAR